MRGGYQIPPKSQASNQIPPKSQASKRPLDQHADDIEEPLDRDPSWLHVLVPDELEEGDLKGEHQPKKVKVEEEVENESPIERRRRKARENAKKRKDRKALQIKIEEDVEGEADWENSDDSGQQINSVEVDTEEELKNTQSIDYSSNNEEVLVVDEEIVDKAVQQRANKAAWQRKRRAEKKLEQANAETFDQELVTMVEDDARNDSEVLTENFEDEEVDEVEIEEEKEEMPEEEKEEVAIDTYVEKRDFENDFEMEEEMEEDEALADASKDVEVVDVEEEDAINEKEKSIFYKHLVKDNLREDEISDDEVENVPEEEEEEEEEDISDNEVEPYKDLIDSYLSQDQDDMTTEDESESAGVIIEQSEEFNSNENKSIEESIENIQSFLDDEDTQDSALEIYPDDDDDEDEDTEEVKEEEVESEDSEEEEDEVPAEEHVSVSLAAHEDMSLVFQKNPVTETAADLIMLAERHELTTQEINWWFIRIREKTRGLGEADLVEFFNKFTKRHTKDGMVNF